MKAKAIKGRTGEVIRMAIDQCIDTGFKPTLAVLFISEDNDRDSITNHLTEKGIRIFGSSTGSNFVDGDIEEGTIVLLLDMKPEHFHLEIISSVNGNTKQTAEEIGKTGLRKFKKPAFLIISGGLSTDGDDIIEGIEKACGKEMTVFGGLASDKLVLERTYVFTNDKLTDHGLLALIVDEEKVSLKGAAIGGWKPLGIDRVITRSDGNIVYTIDNEPALDFVLRYAGIKEADVANTMNFILASNFQLQLLRENKHPVMRTPMQTNLVDRSIVFAGRLPQGSKVRLCLLPGFDIVDESLRQFAKYKIEQPDADALILFSCAGRQLSLGPYVSNEINGIKEIWNAPMAGFFCYGEIGMVTDDIHEFHNMTCSLAILKEK